MPDLRHWKIKGNNFYRKKIGDLGSHKSTKFTRDKMLVDKALTSLSFFMIWQRLMGSMRSKSLSKLL